MSARINRSMFVPAHALGLVCIFVCGMGAASVAAQLAGMFWSEAAKSCATCLDTDAPAPISNVVSTCTLLTSSKSLPTMIAGSDMPVPDTTLLIPYALMHSTALQSSPDGWEQLQVRF